MKFIFGERNSLAVKLTAVMLCVFMLSGFIRLPASATEANETYPLVDDYCSQTAKDALGYEKLQELVDLIVGSIEPQAVNLLIERFPCFREAAANDALGREIGLYIYYGDGDQDGIEEHEYVAPGAYAYVNGYPVYENGKTRFKYMIGIDAETLCDEDDDDDTDGNDDKEPVLDLNGQARVQVDTTFCHELFLTGATGCWKRCARPGDRRRARHGSRISGRGKGKTTAPDDAVRSLKKPANAENASDKLKPEAFSARCVAGICKTRSFTVW